MNQKIDNQSDASETPKDKGGTGWGPKLFLATLAALLVFFWWLLIYSGGVTVHH